MASALVYLIGFPAAGKFTIAKAIAEHAPSPYVVVDNHHINNVIFEVIETDGVRALPPRVWSLIEGVRDAVLAAIEELSPSEWSYVFTNVLIAGSDEPFVDRLAEIADRRGNAFIPVRLHCSTDELARRIVNPERAERLKWIDPEGLRSYVTTHQLVTIDQHPHALELDVTNLKPNDAAQTILGHIARVAGNPTQ